MPLTHGRIVRPGDSAVPKAVRQSRSRPGKVLAHEIVDATVRANRIIKDAEAQIAEKKAEFERFLETERAAIQSELSAKLELSLAGKFVELNALRQRRIEQSHDDIILLARLLSERVLREQLTLDPAQLASFAKKCVAETRGSTHVVIHAHPEDAKHLQAQLENLLALTLVELRVEPDPELLRGDLHLESDVGTLDARLGTQLANLAETIRESLLV